MACYIFASLMFFFWPSQVAAAPLHVAHDATASLLAVIETGGLLPRQDQGAPNNSIDGSAGTHVTPATVGAIVGGIVGVILLLLLLCWCGRMRKW